MTLGDKSILPKGAFFRSVILLGGGTALGQVALVLASPLLTRLYSPSDFGVFSVYVSILTVGLVIASFRYEAAIPLPEEGESAANILGLCIVCVLTFSSAVFVLLIVLSTFVPWIKENRVLALLVPVGLVAGGSYNILTSWAIRRKWHKEIGFRTVLQSLTTIALQISGSFFAPGSIGLVLGHALGQGAGSFSLVQKIRRVDAMLIRKIRISGMLEVARRFSAFPLINSWSAFLNKVSSQLPLFALTLFFSLESAGHFGLSIRLLFVPVTLIGAAISQVFFGNAAAAKRAGTLTAATIATSELLISTGAPIMAAIATASPYVFAYVFGEDWKTAGIYTRLLAPWIFVVFVATPISPLVFALEKQRGELYFQLYLFAARVIGFAIAYHFNSAYLAVLIFGIGSLIVWLFYFWWLLRISASDVSFLLRTTLQELSVLIACYLPFIITSLTGAVKLTGPAWAFGFIMSMLRMVFRFAKLRLITATTPGTQMNAV